MDGQSLEMAVKTLKPGASEDDKVKFLQEAAIMGQFSHSKVIKMYGINTLGDPVSYYHNIMYTLMLVLLIGPYFSSFKLSGFSGYSI